MNALPIEANISEINNGPYYPVRLQAIPRIGELIHLHSFIDEAAKLPPVKHYEVVQVRHDVRDVSKKIRQSLGGCHCATVFVKPSASRFLQS